ncbi:hypothetical protein FEN17_09865 [Dyadobacter luticola]|uniref:Uncharacterized protein n=1 Tax=Dyadobacter luticola TaxID=1979387 RepID=A0A5R9L6L0_9BACT|nr:hypothetical protein FEN17_09865 [Dyadobacter luticola]
MALLDLETSGTKNISASFIAPTEAGEKIAVPADNNTLWLNYSSIQAGVKTKRVEVETSALVDGVDINVVAGSSATKRKIRLRHYRRYQAGFIRFEHFVTD